MTRTTRRLVVATGLSIAIGGAALAPALSAVAASSPGAGLRITVKKVQLVDGGVAVGEKISYTCPPGGLFANISVTLAERVGAHLVSGDGASDSLVCNTKPQAITIFVDGNTIPWTTGPAFNQATIRIFTKPKTQNQVTESKTVKIAR